MTVDGILFIYIVDAIDEDTIFDIQRTLLSIVYRIRLLLNDWEKKGQRKREIAIKCASNANIEAKWINWNVNHVVSTKDFPFSIHKIIVRRKSHFFSHNGWWTRLKLYVIVHCFALNECDLISRAEIAFIGNIYWYWRSMWCGCSCAAVIMSLSLDSISSRRNCPGHFQFYIANYYPFMTKQCVCVCLFRAI